MNTQQFLMRLIPPRPSFAQDMSEDEMRIMGEHAQYWGGLIAERTAVVFGPVLDPNGVWGLGILDVDSIEQAQEVMAKDPSVVAGVNTFELIPMSVGAVRA